MNKKITLALVVAVIIVCGYFALRANGSYFASDSSMSDGVDGNTAYVYETDAEDASQCASFETFDAERRVCSFECEGEQACADAEARAEAEFEGWSDELAKDTSPVDEKAIPSDDPSQKALYGVSAGEKIALITGTDDPENREIWDEIRAISPDQLSDTYINEFSVFDNPSDDTFAFVVDEDGDGKWTIAVNRALRADSTERERKATIIHELGHIISLNSSQVVSGVDKKDCPDLFLDEGCAKATSYVNVFNNNYWKGASKQIYSENTFVTEYAATGEVEDLAESFAFFVLGKGPDVLGSSVKDKKVAMFYSYPELVTIRTDMRKALSTDIIRAQKKVSQ